MSPLYLPCISPISALYLPRSNLRQHQGSFAGGQDLEQKYLVSIPIGTGYPYPYPYPYP